MDENEDKGKRERERGDITREIVIVRQGSPLRSPKLITVSRLMTIRL